MLRELTDAVSAEQKPWDLFLLSFLFSSLAIFFTLLIFSKQGGTTTIILSILVFIPLLYDALKVEEKKDTTIKQESALLREHSKVIGFLVFIFLGNVLSFFLWSLALPDSTGTEFFRLQKEAVLSARQEPFTGNFFALANPLFSIIAKNLKVMGIALVLSALFGFGALYIVAWNASVVGVAIADFVKTSLSSAPFSFMMGVLQYLTHGLPEILGFFIGGLAGGILYIAVVRKDLNKAYAATIYRDVVTLLLYAVMFILMAGLIEVYVTPMFFAA